jgi:hypothetical protein
MRMGLERTRLFTYAKKAFAKIDKITTEEARGILLARYPNARLDPLRTGRILRRLGFERMPFFNRVEWRKGLE